MPNLLLILNKQYKNLLGRLDTEEFCVCVCEILNLLFQS